MSYGQRVATYKQFVDILKNSAERKFVHAPSAERISGLMEGVTVILRLQEMSVDYGEDHAKDENGYYIPRHRVHATILFDYSTYVVDVADLDWFALPPVDRWQASLPVIELPAEEPEEGEEGGSGVREPLPDDSPAPTATARRQPRKRPVRTPRAASDTAAETVPVEAAVE